MNDWGQGLSKNDMTRNGERLVQQAFLSSVDPSREVVLDVGANRGEWTRQLLDLRDELHLEQRLRLTLFEPDPDAADHLRKGDFPLGGGDSLVVREDAVSDVSGSTRLYRHRPMSGINSIVPGDGPGAGDHSSVANVAVSTLDDVRADLGAVQLGFVKVDTEGNDLAVLRGASQSLRSAQIGLLQFEYNHRWIFARAFLRDAFDLVGDLPYSLGRITPDGVAFYSAWDPTLETFRESNWLLVRDDLLSAVPEWK